MLRSHGTERTNNWNKNQGPWYYKAKILGYNYRMTDFQAALGISQLKKLQILTKNKQLIAKKYLSLLAGIEGITLPEIKGKKYNQTWHLFSVGIDFNNYKISKSELMQKLSQKKIETQVHYIPLYRQPIYIDKNKSKYVGSEKYYKSTLSLPMSSDLTDDDLVYIVKNLKNILYSNKI